MDSDPKQSSRNDCNSRATRTVSLEEGTSVPFVCRVMTAFKETRKRMSPQGYFPGLFLYKERQV